MSERLLICSDLDRTLIPNGPQSESQNARYHFRVLVTRPEVTLVYVSGRHRALIEKAIGNYRLPPPDFVVADVGTTIYRVGPKREWRRQTAWEEEIARDWGGKSHSDLKAMLLDLPQLRLQDYRKQNRYKLSYYVPLQTGQDAMSERIRERLTRDGVWADLVWSVDDPAGVGRLDVVPKRAGKFHAVEALMKQHGFDLHNTVFCGNSGNDIEVLTSSLPAVLVANSQQEVRQRARRLANINGQVDRLYIARGDFMGMNGNYAAGVLEGVAHYHPQSEEWMGFGKRRREHS